MAVVDTQSRRPSVEVTLRLPSQTRNSVRRSTTGRSSFKRKTLGHGFVLPPLQLSAETDSDKVAPVHTDPHADHEIRKPEGPKPDQPVRHLRQRHTVQHMGSFSMSPRRSSLAAVGAASLATPRRQTVNNPPRRSLVATPPALPDGLPESARQKWEACEKVRNSHVLRTIFAEARNRHQKRQSFNDRMVERENSKDSEPTLWRLHESSNIFNEVLQDIRGAVKVCCKDLFGKAADANDSAAAQAEEEAVKVISERWRMLQNRFNDGVFASGSLSPKPDKDPEDIWALMFEELATDGTLM